MLRCVKVHKAIDYSKRCFSMFFTAWPVVCWLEHGEVWVFSKCVSPMAAGFANAILCCPQGSSTKPRSLKDLEPALLTKSIWAQNSGQQLWVSDGTTQKVLGLKSFNDEFNVEASFEHHATCVLSIYILPYPSPDRGSLRLLEKVTVRCSCCNINQTPEAEMLNSLGLSAHNQIQMCTEILKIDRWKSSFARVCSTLKRRLIFLYFWHSLSSRLELRIVCARSVQSASIQASISWKWSQCQQFAGMDQIHVELCQISYGQFVPMEWSHCCCDCIWGEGRKHHSLRITWIS